MIRPIHKGDLTSRLIEMSEIKMAMNGQDMTGQMDKEA